MPAADASGLVRAGHRREGVVLRPHVQRWCTFKRRRKRALDLRGRIGTPIFPNTQSPAREIPPYFAQSKIPTFLPPPSPSLLGKGREPALLTMGALSKAQAMDATATLRPRNLCFQSPSTPMLQRFRHFSLALPGAHVAAPPHRGHRRARGIRI